LAFHQDQLQRFALAHSAFDWLGLETLCGYLDRARPPPAQLPQIRKRQRSFGGETFQQLPALMILQASIGALPLQQLANSARDLGHSQRGKLRRDLAHQLQVVAAERASAKG